MTEGQQRPLIFISYSSFDTATKEFVQRHFGVLQTLGDIEVWEDEQIGLGDDWFEDIQTKLETCSVAVLLISHDFLGSKFCMKQEVPVLLERRRREGMMIAPILLSPCAWQIVPWLSAIQMLPRKGKPLLAFDELEQAEKLTEVVITIHDFLEKQKAAEDEQTTIVHAQARGSIRFSERATAAVVKSGTPYPPLAAECVDLTRLPTSGFDVVGRDEELQFLNEAFDGDTLNVVSLRAWGGVGKSTLVNKWCEYLAADNYRDARRTFAWSFYSQGTNERVTSADAFIDEALRFFQDDDPTAGSPWSKGERLAELIGKEKALLILDGMEPLQDEHQGIKDPALARLVECLAEANAGLCVITTREPVREFSDFPQTTQEVDLEQLSKEAGRTLLRIKGLRAADNLLEQASEAFGNNALALNLLASYLKRFAGGDVEKALAIPDLPDVPVEAGKHPRRVMNALAEAFSEGPELDLLHIMGLFDRPADAGCIAALRKKPVIPGLTERLSALDEIGWRDLLVRLRGFGLLAEAGHHAPDNLDAHPLVREHFGARLRAKYEAAWKAGHERLYAHLKHLSEKHQPKTLVDMEPLFQAVHHGCQAGSRQETLDDIYKKSIARKNEAYLAKKLGASGVDLGLITLFFDEPWQKPASDVCKADQAWLLNAAAFCLRALGRLSDALAPMQAGLAGAIMQENWLEAARRASNLAQLQLSIGDVSAALDASNMAVRYAGHGGDHVYYISKRAGLGAVLYQAGNSEKARELFDSADLKMTEFSADYSRLYALAGYCYVDLLLKHGQAEKVCNRAAEALEMAKRRQWLLDIALDHLSLGRGAWALGNHKQASSELDVAVDGLRKAGQIDHLPHGLIARAAFLRETEKNELSRRDLGEVMRIAKRCGLRLHECDAHLEYARLALAEGNPDAALPHFQSADALVTECGYHRRDPDIAELKDKLGL